MGWIMNYRGRPETCLSTREPSPGRALQGCGGARSFALRPTHGHQEAVPRKVLTVLL